MGRVQLRSRHTAGTCFLRDTAHVCSNSGHATGTFVGPIVAQQRGICRYAGSGSHMPTYGFLVCVRACVCVCVCVCA